MAAVLPMNNVVNIHLKVNKCIWTKIWNSNNYSWNSTTLAVRNLTVGSRVVPQTSRSHVLQRHRLSSSAIYLNVNDYFLNVSPIIFAAHILTNSNYTYSSLFTDKLKCPGPNEHYECGYVCDNECGRLGERDGTDCQQESYRCIRQCYCDEGFARDEKDTCIPDGNCSTYGKTISLIIARGPNCVVVYVVYVTLKLR